MGKNLVNLRLKLQENLAKILISMLSEGTSPSLLSVKEH